MSQLGVVTLCGSTRFRAEMERVARELLAEGAIVLAPDVVDGPVDETVKAELDRAHRVKIDLADRVVVVTRDGYVGESTACEIAYAASAGKPIEYRRTDAHVVMRTTTPMTADQQNAVWAGERSGVVAAAIRATVPAGVSGMDYGCGPGHIGLRLASHFTTLSLVDADPQVVDALADKVARRPSLRTYELDLTRQPAREQVDCVFASMSFHHIPDSAAFLDGVANTIRHGGWLVIADFDTDHGQLHSAEPEFDGHHGFDRAMLAAEVAAHGFTDVQVDDVWAGRRWCGDRLVDYSLFLLTARRPTEDDNR